MIQVNSDSQNNHIRQYVDRVMKFWRSNGQWDTYYSRNNRMAPRIHCTVIVFIRDS